MNLDDEMFKQMAVRVAVHFNIINDDQPHEWESLPDSYRSLIIHVSYRSLIVPLVQSDRMTGLTWQQLAIKYRVSVQTIRTILNKRALIINATTAQNNVPK